MSTQDLLGAEPSWDRAMVSGNSIDTALYWSAAIFEREMDRIWKRSWLYVAHESEIEHEGDYVSRVLAREPVIAVRTPEGSILVVENRRSHRGNLLLLDDAGRSGYPAEWFRGDHGLPPLKVETYRGFIFASFDHEVPPLREHLGSTASRIDDFVDLSPTGHLRVTRGAHRHRWNANWKMWVENSVDNYHQNFVHQAPLFLRPETKETSVRVSSDESQALVIDHGNGHAELAYSIELRAMGRPHRTSAIGADERSEADYVARLSDRLGEERAKQLVADGPPHVLIFPNMYFAQQDIRVIEPISPTESHSVRYPTLLDGAPEAVNLARVRRHEQAYGPAGSVLADDIEILGRNQAALGTGTRTRITLDRGTWRESNADDGTRVSHITDELGQRAIWRRYREMMG